VKKIGFIGLVIIAVVLGLLVGTLNSAPILLDLLWIQLELPLGLTILLGFSAGLLTGLVAVYLVQVLPIRLRLRKAQHALNKHKNTGRDATSGSSLPDD